MKLTIPDVPPSLNRVHRLHWRKRVKLNDNWRMWVRSQMNYAPSWQAGKMRCIIQLFHSRAYDKDNAYGAVKPLVDALKHWKLVHDDSPEYLDLEVRQEKCPHKRRHTIIELEAA